MNPTTFKIKKITLKDNVYSVEMEVSALDEVVKVDIAPLELNNAVEILSLLAYTAKSMVGQDSNVYAQPNASLPYSFEGEKELFEVGEIFTLV